MHKRKLQQFDFIEDVSAFQADFEKAFHEATPRVID